MYIKAGEHLPTLHELTHFRLSTEPLYRGLDVITATYNALAGKNECSALKLPQQ